jgi:hypothetical protein
MSAAAKCVGVLVLTTGMTMHLDASKNVGVHRCGHETAVASEFKRVVV